MSHVTADTQHDKEHGHGHSKFLAHHFDTPQQQFDSGKLGLWLFLTTEILLFSGLFCWYAVYRGNHPEIFVYAHTYLDPWLGGINTIVLLFSSFTMAWAVRAAQLGQQKLLKILLTTTLLCGFGFLGIKYVEYKAKIEHGLLVGAQFKPHEPPPGVLVPGVPFEGHSAGNPIGYAPDHAAAQVNAGNPPSPAGQLGHGASIHSHQGIDMKPGSHGEETGWSTTAPGATATLPAQDIPPAAAVVPLERTVPEGVLMSKYAPPATGPAGVSASWVAPAAAAEHHWVGSEPPKVNVFFGIYYVMTGLHGLHVIAGMACIGWILMRSIRGDFGPEYFNPVDFTGLYWHLVDLVWIFLFPLLYLIK